MKLDINPLSPVIGAEVLGLNLAKPLSKELFDELQKAWFDSNGVLVIRNQDLTPDQQIEFSRRFGKLETHVLADYLLPGYPEIYCVSNKVRDGKAMGRAKAGTYWHSDLSYMINPAKASLLYALEIPPYGGDTMFANMYNAYDTLSNLMKEIVSDLKANHDFSYAARGVFSGEEIGSEKLKLAPTAEHPVVRINPDTDRESLYVNPGFTSEIVGLTQMEGTALLEFLNQHSIRPENIYRHRWDKGDVVIWDNRCTMHCAIDDYDGVGDRYMHRTTVSGDEVV